MAPATATELRTEWGAALRKRREERGLTQAALAEMAGLDQASVSRVESGAGGFNALHRIASALDIDLELAS